MLDVGRQIAKTKSQLLDELVKPRRAPITDDRPPVRDEVPYYGDQYEGAKPQKSSGSGSVSSGAGTVAEFDRRAKGLEKHAAYSKLSQSAKDNIKEILKAARGRPNRIYYLEKLELLLNTPDAPAAQTSDRMDKRIDESVKESAARLKTKEGKAQEKVEEKATSSSARRWVKVQGKGAKYHVDRSDPTCVVVKMKVHLKGKAADVARIKKLEDEIEKKASTKGYVVDIEFVNKSGKDVFDVKVDPKQWTTAGNWVGKADSLAHEAHHLLGLDDRYDYIKSHAGNKHMEMETRIHWFNVQMKKPEDPDGGRSIMGGRNPPLHDDVCRVAQHPNQVQCVDDRKKKLGGN